MSLVTDILTIKTTYENIRAYFFQKIKQTQYQNQDLQNYVVDYSVLLAGSQYITYINEDQANAQLQEYIALCDNLIAQLQLNVYTQINLPCEQVQNELQLSISSLSQWAKVLLKAQYANLIYFVTKYDTSMTQVLYDANVSMNTYWQQIELNRQLDFNYIPCNTVVILDKSS